MTWISHGLVLLVGFAAGWFGYALRRVFLMAKNKRFVMCTVCGGTGVFNPVLADQAWREYPR